MDPAEQALLQALQTSPEDWGIRLLVAEKMHARGGLEEAAEVIGDAPAIPENTDQLQKAVTFGGNGALSLVKAWVASHPSDSYGHEVLGHLLEHLGQDSQAAKHYAVANALKGGAEPTPSRHPVEEVHQPAAATPQPFPQPSQQEAVYTEPAPVVPKKQTSSKMIALIVAIGLHAAIGLIAAILVILPATKDDPEIVAAIIGPPAAKREMQKKNVVKQVKKSSSASSAAAPVAKMMRANAMAKFSLPKVTKTSTGPLGMGEGDFGSGGFGGTGSGLGSGASFFGGSATGERFLFVLDHSKSMKPNQVALRNKELEKVLKSLTGVQYQVLLFAGPAWYAVNGWKAPDKSKAVDPRGKTYNFRRGRISGGIPKEKWLEANPTNIKGTLDYVRKTALVLGTDWTVALEVGHGIEPPPDVIFFMADGTGNNSPPPILAINKKRGAPVINMVAMQTNAGAAQFSAIARGTKGTFTIVDKNGKPIDGFEYIKNPGKFKGRI